MDTLAAMPGWRFERLCLAPSPEPRRAVLSLARTVLEAPLRARQHDVLHVHGEVAAGLLLPSLATRPSVVTLHGLHLLRRLDGRRRELARANLKAIVRGASTTICVSEAEAEEVAAAVGPQLAGRTTVVPNGVDAAPAPDAAERAEARAALGLEAGAVAAAWVGSLDERKDPLLACRAVAAAVRTDERLVLLVAGDGPLRPAVEELGDAIRVLGQLGSVRPVLAAADLFVLTSRREGLPYALLEAMAAELPPVAIAGPGVDEAVGDAGILVDGAARLERALVELAASDGRRRELGARAAERVRSHFRADVMRERTAAIYEAAREARRR